MKLKKTKQQLLKERSELLNIACSKGLLIEDTLQYGDDEIGHLEREIQTIKEALNSKPIILWMEP